MTVVQEKFALSLTEEEKKSKGELKSAIVPGDFSTISSFANYATNMSNNIAESILSVASSKSLNNICGNINNVLINVKKIDGRRLITSKKANWFTRALPGWLVSTKEHVVAQFSTLGEQVDKYSEEIKNNLKSSGESIKMMEQMGQNAKEQYRSLGIAISAGKEKLDELYAEFKQKQAQLEQDVDPDPMDIQNLQRLESFLNVLDKKVSNLEQMQHTIYLNMPQLSLMITNEMNAQVELNQIIETTIPLWKQQLSQALVVDSQRQTAEVIEQNKDFTEQLLKKNADNLKSNTVKILKQGSRGMVSAETLNYVQKQLIETLDESIKITQETKKLRLEASKSVESMRLSFKSEMQKVGR